MIHELRIYSIRPENWRSYVRAYEEIGLPILTRYWTPAGFWTAETGCLFRFCHMWAWESFEERLRLRSALQSDVQWNEEYLPVTLHMIEQAENTLLMPTAFCPPLGTKDDPS